MQVAHIFGDYEMEDCKLDKGECLVMDDHQAAKFLGMSVHTLRKHRTQGVGARYCKLGRLVKYRLADLEAYIEKSAVAR
jgi:hypothetical protein